MVPVGETVGASLQASMDGGSCELEALEEYDGDVMPAETGTSECDDGPSRTREKVLSECTATILRRRDNGLGWPVADAAGDTGDGGPPERVLLSCRVDALIGVILVETSDGDLGAGAIGPGEPKGAEG